MDNKLDTARTYYANREKLIYSYRGNTFLQGGELLDTEHGMRGRIDCSTLVYLALQGVSYEASPYVTGETDIFFNTVCGWYHAANDRVTLAQVFSERSDRASDIKRAYGLAKYCRESGMEIGGSLLQPGDLVFFQAGTSVIEEYWKFGAWQAISHVGIVCEDTDYMINATGSSDQEVNACNIPIRYTRIEDKGTPVLIARIPT